MSVCKDTRVVCVCVFVCWSRVPRSAQRMRVCVCHGLCVYARMCVVFVCARVR